MPRPVLQTVIASTRPGRVGATVAEWARTRAVAHGHFDVEVVDLAEVALPFFDEPHHPRLRRYVHQHTLDWSATVERADAFLFVMPEYNHGFNAVIKNAIDFLHHEWQHKPVGFVSYGGVSAGTRAIQMLEPVVGAVGMHPVTQAVTIPFVGRLLDDDGRLQPNEAMQDAITAMLDQVAIHTDVLRPLRNETDAA